MRGAAWTLAILVLSTLGMATLSRAAAPAPAMEPPSAGLHRAGLVVDYGAGRVFTACVAFTETSITGLDLLARAGLPLVTDGGAVCRIGDTGCPAGAPCFCACMSPSPCLYWRYWTQEPGAIIWTFSAVGAADRHLTDGAVDGWSWSEGAPPPHLAFADLCAPLRRVFLPLVVAE